MSLAARVAERPVKAPALASSKVLVWDIETIPARVVLDTYDLKLRQRYIHHSNVVMPGQMFSWAAKWYHEPGRVMYRDHRHPDMLSDLWHLLDEAAYCVTFNGDRFDIRKVRGYFARAGMLPFRPPKSLDLYKTVRTFGWESSSLDYSARMLGVRRKVDNGGAGRIRDALAGDERAYRDVRTYAVGDVRATEELWDALRPWIKGHPIMGYPGDTERRCPRCLSTNVRDCGAYQAVVIRYRQHRCGDCGGLFRSTIHSRAGAAYAL